jgi:hypothetical protein
MALPNGQAGALHRATRGLAIRWTEAAPFETRVRSAKPAVCAADSPEPKSLAITSMV